MIGFDIPLWFILLVLLGWLLVSSAGLVALSAGMSLPIVFVALLVRYLLSDRGRASDRAICRWPVGDIIRMTVTFVGFITLFMLVVTAGEAQPRRAVFVLIVALTSCLLLIPALASRRDAPR